MSEVKSLRIKQPRSLTELVVERMREAIIEGQFALGENISEDKLAEAFGVSRTPVRDALMQLQQTGLVVVRPKRGSFVFSPTLADVEELCEYRLMLEMQALRLSIARDHKGLVKAVRAAIAAMDGAQAAGDQYAYGRADAAFHRAAFDHCGNRLVEAAYNTAEGQLAAIRTSLSEEYGRPGDASYPEHLQMAEMIAAKDMEALATVMDEHVWRTMRVARKSLPAHKGTRRA
ncbi:GntR family transcriptional regulator [Aquamicrobium sp. LC103]|uniref:GntR family transcriptional regulator n=1 Tax=Aquamicrobium sp. LC103 TaxID=1120658 RepID=UPI0009E49C3A|nr:GntR family transcriptional regulator [Aquamicrobium sp. LC103]TKT76331.1 GntR family transcriptional regulator [Aquamicrobium sp. LC103]